MPDKVDYLEATLRLEKETKNTVRYSELPEGPPITNTIYIQKWALKQLGDGEFPEKIHITIEVA